jgi:hypothetical protein
MTFNRPRKRSVPDAEGISSPPSNSRSDSTTTIVSSARPRTKSSTKPRRAAGAPQPSFLSNDNSVTKEEFDRLIAHQTSEASFQEQTVNLALSLQFLSYHTHDSRGSDRGFYDLTLMSERREILMELKRQDKDKGRLSTDQVMWLDRAARLRDSGVPAIEVYVARPLDSDALFITLTRGPHAEGALHQWCFDALCKRCNTERARVVVRIPKKGGRRAR